MKVVLNPNREQWAEIISRPVIDNTTLRKNVGKILSDVKKNGDRSLKKYSKKFDGVSLKKLQLGQKERKRANQLVPEDLS